MSNLIEVLAGVIRGDDASIATLADAALDDVRREADAHGVLPLVAQRLAGSRPATDPLRSVLIQVAKSRAIADACRAHELKTCLDALDGARVRALVMKGAHLAYTHYERPDLRPRGDTDLLIPADARHSVGSVLARCGYTPAGQLPGELVMYQETYTKRRNGMLAHAIDVHWRAANPQAFAGVLSYERLVETAVPIPQLGPGARGLSEPDALLLACVHRVAHHFDDDYLIWLYDIHLLATRLDRAAWERLLHLACQRGVATVCDQGLRRAAHYFHTEVPGDVSAKLVEAAHGSMEAVTAAYLTRRRRHVDNVLADLRALPTWSNRWRLMREHLFPPPRYMRDVYAPLCGGRGVPLPLLYLQRAVRGARKWMSRIS